ncbi:hypothetical protein [Couchioplanes azureus]|uniref:hypothetical protein n=1 Tax=Couchioplanes caeruleus TaxID=56438 RepID=UPI0016708DC3|nr:hypothetical protein [Couchioplanes caeruleus]
MSTHRDGLRAAAVVWDALEEAVHDLPPTPATELFQRFLSWILGRDEGPHLA